MTVNFGLSDGSFRQLGSSYLSKSVWVYEWGFSLYILEQGYWDMCHNVINYRYGFEYMYGVGGVSSRPP